MCLFEDFSNFLESRLDEFLKSNPQLNLSFLQQEVKQQKKDTILLIKNLNSQQKILETKIINLGQEVSTWHSRIEKARQAGRIDLAEGAEKRQASLLQEGNLTWKEMETVKQKNIEAKKLLINLEEKEREINLKVEQLKKTEQKSSSFNYSKTGYSSKVDNDLEAKFQQWEIEAELENLKNNL